ncbi:MAG TPA: mechanosensitive ion channel family protein [Pyrinomonadaceae bacterium]|nr:mechanosensitive ion channel family protein [Pyrinomonadaceae bacterium]
MAATELRKKLVYFLIFASIVALILITFPFIEELLRAYLTENFGLIIAANGGVTVAEGVSAPSMMTETTIGLIVNLLHIVKILLWMALVVSVVRFVGFLVVKTAYRNAEQGEVSSLIKTVLSIIIYIVAFFMIFQSQFPGVQLTALFTGSTILGIVVGLALQDTLGNLFAGLALSADQPFVVGDVILIPGRGEGVIEHVSWRGVKIRTFQNKLLVISNSVLGKEIFEVAPKNNLNAKIVFFNSLYSNSPAKTIQAIREAVRQVENVSPKIRPVVRIRNLAADGIDWEVKYWLEDYRQQHDTDALVRQRIWYVFQREKIHFAYPTRTVYIETKPDELPPEDVINNIAEHLNRVSIFAPLSDEEIERLANASTTRIYAPGENIVNMGQEGNSMFVVISGTVKVQIPELSYQKTIGTLRENDFFGEMSLLTGEPRSATVVAFEESEVLRIDKSGLKPIFESNPVLVESISELVEERRALLTAQIEAQAEEEEHRTKKGVMKSIKSFFGLSKSQNREQ